ncbi:MAG: flagellar basal body rod protein FlgB [Eubacterium sp.]|nr:flagellar basal body rod protein FlgB [Eubacterium sp.]
MAVGLYDYVDVLAKAADASWLKNETISQNIANVDTVNYNRQDVDFEGALQQALLKNSYISLDDKVSHLDMSDLDVKAFTEYSTYSYRLDGNNVDIDTENVELAANQLVYQGLTSSITSELARIESVCK